MMIELPSAFAIFGARRVQCVCHAHNKQQQQQQYEEDAKTNETYTVAIQQGNFGIGVTHTPATTATTNRYKTAITTTKTS
jgi:hypothetical protein